MSDDIESLRAEVAALRAELADRHQGGVTRRRLITGLAGLGAAGATGLASAQPASAAAGDDVVLGQDNVSDVTTRLRNGGSDELPDEPVGDPVLYVEDGSQANGIGVRSSDTAIVAAGTIEGIVATGASGVRGVADTFVGVYGVGHDGAVGVGARSPDGPGLYVEQSAVHAYFRPPATVGPPTLDVWDDEPGMLHVDSNADVWLCTAGGDPGTWTRLVREDTGGRTVPIPPMRALDTRATGGRPAGSPVVPGQKKGPLTGGSALTLDLAGVAPIPATATGVVGNLTVTSPTYNGYLVVGPSGTTPSTSALNFTTGTTVANAFTSQLGPAGITIRGSGTTSKTYELIVDITAYIT